MDEREAIKTVLDNDEARALVVDAQAFEELKDSKAWHRLRSLLDLREQEWLAKITRRFSGPKSGWPTAEEIAYHRGFYDGFSALLKTPDVAERNLERLAEEAWRLYTSTQEVED